MNFISTLSPSIANNQFVEQGQKKPSTMTKLFKNAEKSFKRQLSKLETKKSISLAKENIIEMKNKVSGIISKVFKGKSQKNSDVQLSPGQLNKMSTSELKKLSTTSSAANIAYRTRIAKIENSLEALPLDKLKVKASKFQVAKRVYERKLEKMSITQLLPLSKECPIAKKTYDKKSLLLKYTLAQMPRKKLFEHAKKSKFAKQLYYQKLPLKILKKQVQRDPLAKSIYKERLQLELLKKRGDKSLKGREALFQELEKVPLYLLEEKVEGSKSGTNFFIKKLQKAPLDELGLLAKTSPLAFGIYSDRLRKLPMDELKQLIANGDIIALAVHQDKINQK